MTLNEAVKKYGGVRPTARAVDMNYSAVRNHLMQGRGNQTISDLKKYRAVPPAAKAAKAAPRSKPASASVAVSHGISLAGVKVCERKPAETLKGKLFALRRGMGYPLADLSDQWGVSQDNIRKHARRLDCLLYVETSPGEWVLCVLHPETADQYRKDNAS